MQPSAAMQLQQAKLQQAQFQQAFLQHAAGQAATQAFIMQSAMPLMPACPPQYAAPDMTNPCMLPFGTPPTISEQYVDMDCFVHNTFIHAKGPPPSPAPGCKRNRRSRSVPRNIGSDKQGPEADVSSPNGGHDTDPGSKSELHLKGAHTAPPTRGDEGLHDMDQREPLPEVPPLPASSERTHSSLALRREFATSKITMPQEKAVDQPAAVQGQDALPISSPVSPPAYHDDGEEDAAELTIPNTPASPLSPASISFRTRSQRRVPQSTDGIATNAKPSGVLEVSGSNSSELAAMLTEAELQRRRSRRVPESEPLPARRRATSADGPVSIEQLASVAHTPSPCRSPLRMRHAADSSGPTASSAAPQRIVRLADLV
jgi:hypothetical protein